MQPIRPENRIASIDILRGISLLGILIINIQAFSMPAAAYRNPTSFGDLTGINKLVWLLSHIFGEQKFITIFSILFGAGMVLMTQKKEGIDGNYSWIQIRRLVWLILFGLAHAYFLWYGDILVCYGICGLVIFGFRTWSPRWLLAVGCVLFLIPAILSVLAGLSIPKMQIAELQQLQFTWKPPDFFLQTEIAIYQSGWWKQMMMRYPSSYLMQTQFFFNYYFWFSSGLMLIGMALYKYGLLTLRYSKKFYIYITMSGFITGFVLIIYGILSNFKSGWSLEYSRYFGSLFNYFGSLLVALGYIGLIMLMCRSERFCQLARPIATLGRTALSNYLLQTVICTTIFYGHGFGLFGKLTRSEQILVVLGIWIFQLVLTSLWLNYFRFGPMEWLWRTLSYWKFQPIRN